MKAIRMHDYGPARDLRIEDVPAPHAGPGQLLVRTRAVGVNPVDWKIRRGETRGMFDLPPLPLILGTEASGLVEALGEGVTGFAVGDAVIAFLGVCGAYAEYIAVDAANVAAKPAILSFEQAASVPMSVQTAWGVIIEAAASQSGESLLILGAAGAVGRAAVQIARMLGVEVYGTCSSRNSQRLRDLGAHPIAYDVPGGPQFPDVDVIVDLIGGEAAAPALERLRKGGRYITAISPVDAGAVAARGFDARFFAISASADRLRKVVEKIEEGTIRMGDPIVYSFDQVAEAHALSESGHPSARIIMRPAG
jgi:NADPH:quinone reductase-like Zn-dependent oxidoreductase